MDKHLEIIAALTNKLEEVKKKNSRRKRALKELQKAYIIRDQQAKDALDGLLAWKRSYESLYQSYLELEKRKTSRFWKIKI